MDAEALKRVGNEYFKKEKYQAAIDQYTSAILCNDSISTYYTNRALCYLKKNDYTHVISDCTKAITLDSHNIKGHYLLGVAHVSMENYETGIAILESTWKKICDLKSKGFSAQIQMELLKAKKAVWVRNSQIKIARLLHVQNQLSVKHSKDNDDYHIDISHALENEMKTCFEGHIPEHLCCSISMEIMLDPVSTPNGISYERQWIEKHIVINGGIDPITRNALSLCMLRPNVALREVIEQYLEDNPWAYQA